MWKQFSRAYPTSHRKRNKRMQQKKKKGFIRVIRTHQEPGAISHRRRGMRHTNAGRGCKSEEEKTIFICCAGVYNVCVHYRPLHTSTERLYSVAPSSVYLPRPTCTVSRGRLLRLFCVEHWCACMHLCCAALSAAETELRSMLARFQFLISIAFSSVSLSIFLSIFFFIFFYSFLFFFFNFYSGEGWCGPRDRFYPHRALLCFPPMSLPVFHSICSFLWFPSLAAAGAAGAVPRSIVLCHSLLYKCSPHFASRCDGSLSQSPRYRRRIKENVCTGLLLCRVWNTGAASFRRGEKENTHQTEREFNLFWRKHSRERIKKKMRQRGRERKERMKKALDDNSQANI